MALLLLGVSSMASPASGAVLPPVNDDFANAAVLSVGVTASADLTAATTESNEPNVTSRSTSAWWVWAAPADMRVHVVADCAYFVYSDSGGGFAGLVAQNWSGAAIGYPGGFDLAAQSGVRYLLQCIGYGLSPVVHVVLTTGSAPANDDFVNATSISLGAAVSGDATFATLQAGEPIPSWQGAPYAAHGKSLWWTWTADTDEYVHFPGYGAYGEAGMVYREDGPGFAGLVSVGSNVYTFAAAGTTYAFQMVVQGGTPGVGTPGLFTRPALVEAAPPPPPNDDLANATPITLDTSASADLSTATLEPDEPMLPDFGTSPNTRSVWWSWTAPTNVTGVHVQFGGVHGAVYAGSGPGFAGLRPLTLAEHFSDALDFDATSGTVYLFQAQSYVATTGVISLSQLPPPPANDNLANARTLQLGDNKVTVNIDGATVQPGEPVNYAGFQFSKSAWWTWTAPKNMSVSVGGQLFMPMYAVQGPGMGGLTLVTTSPTRVAVSAGTTYAFQTLARNGQVGYPANSWDIIVQDDHALPPPPNDNLANATPLQVGAPKKTVDMRSATMEPGEPNPYPNDAPNTAWWSWSPTVATRAWLTGCFHGRLYRADGPGFDGLVDLGIGGFTGSVVVGNPGDHFYEQCFDAGTGVGMELQELASHVGLSSGGAVPGTVTITGPQGTYVVNATTTPLTAGSLPPGAVDLSGALSYGITGITPGATVQVAIDLPAGSAPTVVYKLISGSYQDVSGLASITGDTVTLTLTDGGQGDADGAANGTISDPVVIAATTGPPAAPRTPSAIPGAGSATVSWAAPAHANGAAITKYVVTPYRAGIAQRPREFTPTARSGIVTGLTNGASYTFRIAAKNTRGTGQKSTPTKAVTIGTPLPPTALRVARTAAGRLRVTFTPGTSNGARINHYSALCKSLNQGSTKSKIGIASPIIVTGLTSGKKYTCTVSATNSRGTGPPSTASAIAAA